MASTEKSVKLTKAQVAVLRQMAGGDVLCLVSGRHAHYFWHNADRHPSPATVHALWKAGFVEVKRAGVGGSDYTITTSGRLALAQSEGE